MRLGGVPSASACGAFSCSADQPAFMSRPASHRLQSFTDPGTDLVPAKLGVIAFREQVLTCVAVLQANVVSVMRFELFWTCMHCGSDVPEVRLCICDLLIQL